VRLRTPVELSGERAVSVQQGCAKAKGQFDRRLQQQRRNGVQVISSSLRTQSSRFKRDAAAASRRVENVTKALRLRSEPPRARIAIRFSQPYPPRRRGTHLLHGGDGIPVNAKRVKKLGPVGVHAQETPKNRRSACHERASSKPHVQVRGRRQHIPGHRDPPLASRFSAQRRDRQPILNQSSVAHGVVIRILNDASTRRG
jgi:hypothetical protein